MRKFLVSLMAIAVLGAGAAFAQSGYWAGVSVGYPGAALHFGLEDVSPNLDVRINAGYNYIGTGGFALGADVLYNLPIDMGSAPIDVYAGGGIGLGVGAGIDIGLNLFAGGEFSLAGSGMPEGGIFLEVGPALGFTPSFNLGVTARLGFNYHF